MMGKEFLGGGSQPCICFFKQVLSQNYLSRMSKRQYICTEVGWNYKERKDILCLLNGFLHNLMYLFVKVNFCL